MPRDHTRMVNSLNIMFLTLPLPQANADPNEALNLYYNICANYSNEDIDLAVKQFVSGTVKGVNPDYAPSAPRFAQQLRANLDYRATSIQSQKKLTAQYEDQKIDAQWQSQRTPEAKERVKAILASQLAKAQERTPDEAALAAEIIRKHDQLFADEFIEGPEQRLISRSLARRLGVFINDGDDLIQVGNDD